MLSQHREVSSVLNFKRVKRFGYIDTELTVIDELLSQSEYDLFVKTRIRPHSLHYLLPRIVVETYKFIIVTFVRSLYKIVASNY